MSILLVVALCGVVLVLVFICAACYISGAISELEQQQEFMAFLMRVQQSNEADDAN